MLNTARRALFCFCITLAAQSATSSRLKRDTTATPSVNIIPASDGNFIYFEYNHKSTAQPYIDSINKFLNAYDETNRIESRRNCDYSNPPPENTTCVFDKRRLHFCSQQDYNYTKGSPCVYFTLSQVLDWMPQPLNESDVQHPHTDAFSKIPKHLADTIIYNENQRPWEKLIWLSCDGDTAADKEFVGPISYYPNRGFPTYYFPFKNIEGYQSPIVAVHFQQPMRGVAITIFCKAWAKNIPLDEEKGLGFVKFVLLID